MRIAPVLLKVMPDVRTLNLLFEQVGLVEEEDNRDLLKGAIVDDRVEDVARLEKSIGAPVFEQDLVIFTRRCEEQNRFDVVKTLVPALALGSLASDVDEAKRDIIYEELVLRDSLCGFASVKDILFGRYVALKRCRFGD